MEMYKLLPDSDSWLTQNTFCDNTVGLGGLLFSLQITEASINNHVWFAAHSPLPWYNGLPLEQVCYY